MMIITSTTTLRKITAGTITTNDKRVVSCVSGNAMEIGNINNARLTTRNTTIMIVTINDATVLLSGLLRRRLWIRGIRRAAHEHGCECECVDACYHDEY